MNKDNNVIKIADIVDSQIPDFIHSENPNFIEFLKQYYYSQEFKGGNIDLSENLIDYKNTESFDSSNLIEYTELNSDVDYFNDVINVNSTDGWPNQYGLLKIDNEIITYTGITTNSFTGCIRGFSGTSSLRSENDPEFLVFEETSSDFHYQSALVYNLSNLFLQEFFKKNKYQFTPGFGELNFDSKINKQNFISHVKDFYKSKGTNSAFDILFKVLYNTTIDIITPNKFCFTTSDGKWLSTLEFFAELVSGNPNSIKGESLIQNQFGEILPAVASIQDVNSISIQGDAFYKINIFSGYSNNRTLNKTSFGEFVPTNKTYVVSQVYQNDSTITVDSSIGFPNIGKLEIENLIITYTDKTNNQFLNCSGITTNISIGTGVYSENYVYSYEAETNNLVKFRILNTISNITDSNALYSLPGDGISVENLGNAAETVFTKSLIYNLPLTIFAGKPVNEFLNTTNEGINYTTNLVRTKFNHRLQENDTIDLYENNTNKFLAKYVCSSTNLQNQFSISSSPIDLSIIKSSTKFKRILKKSLSDSYPEINNYTSDIQNSFEDDSFYYINSNGLPSFKINPYKRKYQASVDSDYITLSVDSAHNFSNGDIIVINEFAITMILPDSIFNNKIGISTGISLYVNNVTANKIRLAYSQKNIEASEFINFSEIKNFPIDNRITGYISSLELVDASISRNNSELNSSKSFKKIPRIPYFSNVKHITSDTSLAILTNGIEIQNYKSSDIVYYGKIKNIEILNSGKNYNLRNPPKFNIDSGNDTSTVVFAQLSGNIKEFKVLNSGFDYVETPIVLITGGGVSSSGTDVKMELQYNKISFNTSQTGGIIDIPNNLFNIGYNHRFLTGESVIYRSGNSKKIEIDSNKFLSNESTYYIIRESNNSFKLAYSKLDSFLGKAIDISAYGEGYHSLTSTIGKYCINSVVSNNDVTFRHKKLPFNSTEINSFDNIFIKKGHGFDNNDEVMYSCISGNPISGISINTYYYIHKIDDNKFKLKSTQQSNNFIDFGISNINSYHAIEFSPIRISIKGKFTISGISQNGYDAVIEPVILGSVHDVLVAKTNINYGTNSQLNYNKYPKIEPILGEGAYIAASVLNGKIDYISIKNQGSNYYNQIELNVIGDGIGALLNPTVVNGRIVNVSIINPGIGYNQYTTRIEIKEIGQDLILRANIQSWNVNRVLKFGITNCQNGILLGKKHSLYGNIFRVCFVTRDLIEYYKIPILTEGESSATHSPIIGWAYDGCPIYGPDGYTDPTKISKIKRLKSSYLKESISQISIFDIVEDYKYVDNLGDLDKHNGRFCITPEYPDGVYAYFATMENNGDPVFPYIIGNTYKFTPAPENFDIKYCQDLNINNYNIIKHTSPYRVDDKDHYYEYFKLYTNNDISDIIVSKSSTGNLNNIIVADGGIGYKIGESINFDNSYTDGVGAIAKISEISGVEVSSITSNYLKFDNVTLISENNYTVGIASTYHGFIDNSYINISNSSVDSANYLEGFKEIKVDNYSTKLSQVLKDSSITGLTTSIKIVGPITKFEVDSHIKIKNSEICKVIGLDYINNSLTILRPSDSEESAIGSLLQLLPNQFKIYDPNSAGFKTKNSSYYFVPNNSVSLGTSILVGVGNILNIPVPNGIDYNNYVETGGIYLPNHKFKSGDKLVYSYEGATPIVTNQGNLNSLPNIYVIELQADVIGLVTEINFISDKSNRILFTAANSNQLHKFKTDMNVVTISASSNNVTVNTTNPHNLLDGDEVSVNVISGITTTLQVSYEQNTAKLKIYSKNNPEIELFRNSIVNFDLSSQSLLGLIFKIYTDENFINEYVGTNLIMDHINSILKLTIDESTPDILYYNLESTLFNVYSDESVLNFNQIKLKYSYYNAPGKIISKDSTSFSIPYSTIVEIPLYEKDNSSLSYNVTKTNTSGSISKVSLISKGSDYKKLPSIINISSFGSGAKLIPNSNNIGKINDSSIINNQFIMPSDKTLKPYSELYSTLIVNKNFKVESIDVIMGGSNYLNPPIVNLYDINTDNLVSNFYAVSVLKNTSVEKIEIITPGNGIQFNNYKIVFTNNSNGLKILNVGIAGTMVTLTLENLTPTSAPLSEGDLIFVEGILGSNINSKSNQYEGYEIIEASIPTEINSFTVKYYTKITASFLNITDKSYAVNVKYLPEVKCNFVKNEFYTGESILDTKIIENTKNTPIFDVIKVKNSNNLRINQIIKGNISHSEATIYKIEKYKSNIDTISGNIINFGEISTKGSLSEVTQKLQDNDYYQNFSYSIKSNIQIADWNDNVSKLSHISGFKKFGEFSINTNSKIADSNISDYNSSSVNITIESYADETSHFDYDLVSENVDDHPEFSNIIKFKTKKLSDYILSKENRVLSLDDISGLFNTRLKLSTKILIDQIYFPEGIALKYLVLIQSSESFFGDLVVPSYFELVLTRDDNTINLTSYAYDPDKTLGLIQAVPNEIFNSTIDLFFVPFEILRTYSIRAIRVNIETEVHDTESRIGNSIRTNKTLYYPAEEGSPTTKIIYSVPISNVKSGSILVGISSSKYKISSVKESSFLIDSQDIEINVYATNEISNVGEINISKDIQENLIITYDGISGIGVTVYTDILVLTEESYSEPVEELFQLTKSESINFQGNSIVSLPTTLQKYGVSKYLIEVTKSRQNGDIEKSMIQLNNISYSQDYNSTVSYGIIGNPNDLNFYANYNIELGESTLVYEPTEDASYNIKFYQQSISKILN